MYTGDVPSASKSEILARAESRFGISIDPRTLAFVPLERRWMVEDGTYQHFTLLGQCWGSIWLGFEAMASIIPDVYIDTMGYAFTYPVVRWFAPKSVALGAYVHYPVISTDMLNRVASREAGHTNQGRTAHSWLRTTVKVAYYRLLARAYGWTLRRADVIVVNGTWTQNHINHLTGSKAKVSPQSSARTKGARSERKRAEIVYPPCDTTQLASFPLTGANRDARLIVSLAQFRPEKEHPTQLRILATLLSRRPDLFSSSAHGQGGVKLLMMGSARNSEDETRIKLLRALAVELGVDQHVEFLVNAPFTQIMHHLSRASIGLSTMKDEHFGINVVEFMASGLITLSHKSAGPYMDIAIPTPANNGTDSGAPHHQVTGFHALTVDDFATTLAHILDMNPESEALPIRQAARQRAVQVFGRDGFTSAWEKLLWEPLTKICKANSTT